MAAYLGMVVVAASGDGVPIIFRVDDEGLAVVSAFRLSLRFHLRPDTIYVDEEIFDGDGRILTHTIGQLPNSVGESTFWHLKPGKYRAYGVSNLVDLTSKDAVTLNRSSSSSFQTPQFVNVKVEFQPEDVTVLSTDLDANTPEPPIILESPSSVTALPTLTTLKPDEIKLSGLVDVPVESVIDCFRGLRALKGCRNVLSKIDYDTIDIKRVTVLPPTFNGNVIFEFLAVERSSTSSQANQMSGMDKRYNGHVWLKTMTTNIINRSGLLFRTSVCLGHLRCINLNCKFLNRVHRVKEVKEMEWEGLSPTALDVGQRHPAGSTLVSKICKEPPLCIARCDVRVYYVGRNSKRTRAFVHLGIHKHSVKDGELRDMQDKTRSLISKQIESTPSATISSIILNATKELLGDLLLHLDGELPKTLDFNELVPVLDKCKYFSSPSIRNKITSFKYLRRFGIIDSITKLRGSSTWAFVQESRFPGQGTDVDKVFVFKMSEVGLGSGVDLVKRMQTKGDLEEAWIMFDHVKGVKGWTTMACHVYNSLYCRVMTIAISDMQSEDSEAQILFWRNLNAILERHGVAMTQFKGFMANSAQTKFQCCTSSLWIGRHWQTNGK